jgi:hypothetical protein
MNSKDAARLCFGNPGFLDFLNPIINLAKSNIALVKDVAASNVNPTFSAVANPLLSAARETAPLASQIPYVGHYFQPLANQFYEGAVEDDGTGPNATDDADDQDEGI